MTLEHHYIIRHRRPWRQIAALVALRIASELLLRRMRARTPGLWRTEQLLRLRDSGMFARRPLARLGCTLLCRWHDISAEADGCHSDY